MFLIPLRPCKCSSFHNLSCQMHGIQLSRELEAPSTSIRRVDHLQHTQPAQLAGLARGFTPRFVWWFRVAAMKVPGHKNPTSYADYSIRVQLSAFTYSNFVLFLGFKSTDENSNRQMQQLYVYVANESTRYKTACCCYLLLYSPQNENSTFNNA